MLGLVFGFVCDVFVGCGLFSWWGLCCSLLDGEVVLGAECVLVCEFFLMSVLNLLSVCVSGCVFWFVLELLMNRLWGLVVCGCVVEVFCVFIVLVVLV